MLIVILSIQLKGCETLENVVSYLILILPIQHGFFLLQLS